MSNIRQIDGRTFGKLYAIKDPGTQYAAKNSLRLHPAQEKLIERTLPKKRAMMLGSPDQINFLQLMCQSIGAKKTLDIGVYTGYSALSVALALPDDGKLVALDIDDDNVLEYGLPAWKEAGVDKKIEFIKGSAVESLQKLLDRGEAGTYDFAFVDADKENYDSYYELCLKLLRKNGVIAFDNMLWGGKVYDDSVQDSSTVALRKLAEKAHTDDRVKVSLLAIGDGTLFVTKL